MNLRDELGLQFPLKDVRHEAVLNIVRTGNLVSVHAAQLLRHFDLTEAQFNVMYTLDMSGEPMTQAELGKRIVVTRASITSVLDKLESKKLVVRKKVEGNRRIHHVVLTEEGQRLFDRVEPVHRREVQRVLQDLDEFSCGHLSRMLESTRERVRLILVSEEEPNPVQ